MASMDPPGKANGVTQVVPPLSGHKPGVYRPSLEGHAPGDTSLGKRTFPGGLASNGSSTTSGASYALGTVPD